jgi:hypothetical protein
MIFLVSMNGSQEILMPLRLRLRGLSLALIIFAVLGAGMLVSACGTVAGTSRDGAGYNTDPIGAPSVRAHPIEHFMKC